MDFIPLVYVKDGRFLNSEGKKIRDTKGFIENLNQEILYVIDIDGITKNQPNLDFYQRIGKDLWIDSSPRTFEDIMDVVVTGVSRLTIRERNYVDDINKIFDNIEIELYLGLDARSDREKLYHSDWSGMVFLVDNFLDFEIREKITNFSRDFDVCLVVKEKGFIDISWAENAGVKIVAYPYWEMRM